MKFYTSVLPYRGRLLVRGVNHDGSHKKFRINYKPSLFIPSGKESKYKTRYVNPIKDRMTILHEHLKRNMK